MLHTPDRGLMHGQQRDGEEKQYAIWPLLFPEQEQVLLHQEYPVCRHLFPVFGDRGLPSLLMVYIVRKLISCFLFKTASG